MTAMQEESAALVNAMDVTKTERIGRRDYHTGYLCGQEIVLVFSHWGKVAAAITATCLISDFDVDEIIFTGVAGAIDEKVSIGDIIVANNLYQHDMDVRPILDRHEIPLLGSSEISTSPQIKEHLLKAAHNFIKDDLHRDIGNGDEKPDPTFNPSAISADIASGDQFISKSEHANDIRDRLPSVACVEMEGAAVAQVCNSYNVPFGIVRTISDSANKASENDFNDFILKKAQVYSLGIIKKYLTDS